MGRPVSKSFAILFSVCWIAGIFGMLLAPPPYNQVAIVVGVVAIALTIPLLLHVKAQPEEEKSGKKIYSSRAWTGTIWFFDSLALLLVAYLAYRTWLFYRLSGEVAIPVGYSTLVYAALFFLIRSMAVNEKKKALAREHGRV